MNAFYGLGYLVTTARVQLNKTWSNDDDRVATAIDLTLLNRACAYWLHRHPLLQSTVHRQYTDASESAYYVDASHFVRMRYPDPFEMSNVELVVVNDPNRWTRVMQEELAEPLDNINGPLWRLKVVQLNNNTKEK